MWLGGRNRPYSCEKVRSAESLSQAVEAIVEGKTKSPRGVLIRFKKVEPVFYPANSVTSNCTIFTQSPGYFSKREAANPPDPPNPN